MRRMPSLIALRFFEETARHLSFNRAATSLCVTQGAVSRQIRLLEDSVGARLFERDHKGVKLTAAGMLLLPFIEQAFDTIERGVLEITAVQPGRKRRLTVSVPPPSPPNGSRRAWARCSRRCPRSTCRSAPSPATIAIAISASAARRAPTCSRSG